MLKIRTHSALAILFAASLAGPAVAQTTVPEDQQLGRAIADLSSTACYGIATGTIVFPSDHGPDSLEQTISLVGKMGLGFGINDRMLKALGPLGQTLVTRATMGSKALDHGDVVVTFGGPQQGCRVLLLADTPVNVTKIVGVGLAKAGWKAVPTLTTQRGMAERRVFLKRDAQGSPYLMNLWTIGDATSKLRFITTTVRIPAGVSLPAGF